jgi:hypothetical protein
MKELETDCRIWEQNANIVLRKLKDEQTRHYDTKKLVWNIVMKYGGEIRLKDLPCGILRNDWELLEYTDVVTDEFVIKARKIPMSKLGDTVGLAKVTN